MNAKRVSFSDVNEILTIPRVGTKKLMTPWKKDLIVYSNDDLEKQIKTRKEDAIRRAKREFINLERYCRELHAYIQTIDEDDDEEYQDYHERIEENFFQQSILTRKLIALFADK